MDLKKIFSPKVRRYIYVVAIAFIPLAGLWGWISPEAMPLVVPLIMAVLNIQDDPGQTVTTYDPSETGDGR